MKTTIAFDQSDVKYLVEKGLQAENFISTELTPEQFRIFEEYCSGSSLSGGFEAATEWAKAHFEELDKEAQEWADDDSDHPAAGYYHLPMGYCRFAAVDDFVFYETTRGTLLVVAKDGYYVRIPSAREGGFHHSVLQNLLDGWTEDQIDRRINSHLYTERVRVERTSVVEDEFEDYDGEDYEDYGI